MRGRDSKLEHLAHVRLFSACSKKDLATIGRASDEVTLQAGKTIVQEGTLGQEFFLILDGEAVVKKEGREVAKLGPGQYFGEMALLDKGPRSATVEAATEINLLVLGQREFGGLLDEVPGLAHKLLSTMAARLREADEKAFSN